MIAQTESARAAWVLMLSAAGILLITTGARQSLGLFIAPVNETTGIGIVGISFALAVGQLVWGAVQPVFGAIADQHGATPVLLFGTVLMAAGLALSAFAESQWTLIASLGVLSAAGAGAASFSILIGATAARLAPERRSFAGGFINAGASLGQFVYAPLAQGLIAAFGWVSAMLALAASRLLTLPLIASLRGRRETPAAAQTMIPVTEKLGAQVRLALRDRSYLLLHAGFFTCGLHIAFLVTHLPGEVGLCGLPASVSATALALIGLFNIAGSLTVGALGNRYRMKYLLFAMYASRALIIGLYLLAPRTPMTFYLFAAALGFSWLATVPPTAGLVAKLFGTRYLGTLFGLTLLSHQLGGFFGAWLGGLTLSRFGDYGWMWYADMVLAAMAALVCLPIREARLPKKEPRNRMKTYDYDLFVIGGGSGGVRAARIAAEHGARVAIAEEFRYGGTCVIRGCIPKKLLVYASRFADEFEDAAGFGWTLGEPHFDWPTLIAAKDREIARLEGVYAANLDRVGVTRYDSRAVLRDAHTVHIATGTGESELRADKILIATGGAPKMYTHCQGREHAISSNEIFDLPKLPERIVITGGGYIAVEFACLLHGLGAEVTVVHRSDEVLRGFDRDLRKNLHEAMAARGIRMRLGRMLSRIDRDVAGLRVTLDDGLALVADQVLVAIGREPHTAGLGLEAIGVELGKKGEIKVDAYSQSSVPNIFAVGDVTDRVNLTPVAIREGHAFADSEFGGRRTAVDHHLIPTAVFTTPEIGTVGLTEEAARKQYAAVDVYRSRFRPLKATLGGRAERMMIKLVVDFETDKVLGVHVLGPDAGEMAQLLGIPLLMGATKAQFDATMAVHPTAAEEIVTMREPVERHRH